MMLLANFKEGIVINPLNISQVSIRPMQDTTMLHRAPLGLEIVFIMGGAVTKVSIPFETIPDRKKREAAKRILENKKELEKATQRLSMKLLELLTGQGVMALDHFIDYAIFGEG